MSRSGEANGKSVERAITFRWDLDKTYLRTEFESLRKMVRIPFEKAQEKVHLPGVPQLIRGLRRYAVVRGERPSVFFLSASPPQIGAAIREKLELDGVEFEGITFKDQLGHLVRGRWRSLREQVGYKLGELLAARAQGPAASREVLFGDDWESDPLIYSLYADVVAGALPLESLARILRTVEVQKRAIDVILEAASALGEPAPGTVLRVYINLERRTPPSQFHPFGARLVPAFNYLQTGASLYELDLLDVEGVLEIAAALVESAGYTSERLRNSLDDLARRGHLSLGSRSKLIRALTRAGLANPSPREAALRERLRAAFQRWRRKRAAESPAGVDYERILALRSARS